MMFPVADGSNGSQRADTLALKQALADHLSPDQGQDYWNALGNLLVGRITRDEWEEEIKDLLTEETAQLHNALVLSILYNTTRPAQAPPASVRHSGWSKRRRGGDSAAELAASLDPREAKRRRIKEAVFALGKRERQRLKNLALTAPESANRDKLAFPKLKEAKATGATTPVTLRMKGMSNAFQQDYLRCQQALYCGESKLLPDVDTLKDRMSLMAYDAGLSGGADQSAASLCNVALEMYLKDLLSGVIDLVRSNRAQGLPTPSMSKRALLLTAAAGKIKPSESPPAQPATVEPDEGICVADVGAFLHLSPQTLVSPFVGAVEAHLSAHRWTAPPDSDSDSETEAPQPLAGSAKDRPRISIKRDPSVASLEPKRTLSADAVANGVTAPVMSNGQTNTSVASAPAKASPLINGASPGKNKVKPKPKRTSTGNSVASPATAPTKATATSPSLKAQLFPEVTAKPSSQPPRNRRHSIGSSTDGADSDDRERKESKKSAKASKPAKGTNVDRTAAATTASGKGGKKDAKWEMASDGLNHVFKKIL